MDIFNVPTVPPVSVGAMITAPCWADIVTGAGEGAGVEEEEEEEEGALDPPGRLDSP